MKAWLVALPETALVRLSQRSNFWLLEPPSWFVSVPDPDWVVVKELTQPREVLRLSDVPLEQRTARNVVVGVTFLDPVGKTPPSWVRSDTALQCQTNWSRRAVLFQSWVLACPKWIVLKADNKPTVIHNPKYGGF